jgi:hypothetical protein
MAAQAIAHGDRAEFDRRADPTRRYSQADQAPAASASLGGPVSQAL